MENKMTIEIWSDVMCPFCYIGKAKFEKALSQFNHSNQVKVLWKSFQLMPELEPGKVGNLEDILVHKKGMSPEQVKTMNARVAQIGKEAGVEMNFDKVVAVNTLNAHRFAHVAREHGKQNEAEDILFQAYFTDGKNVDDQPTLIELGKRIGLNEEKLQTALESGSYADAIAADIQEAQQLGIRGVPFFVMNRKYAVSGAQESSSFLEALKKSFAEWQKDNPGIALEVIEGSTCTTDGQCD